MYKTATERTVAAAKRYLEMRGYEVLDELERGGTPVLVADDEGERVFVDVRFSFDGMPHPRFDREAFEEMAGAYVAEHDVADCTVRADSIAMMVVADNRAFLKHTVNWSNGPEAA